MLAGHTRYHLAALHENESTPQSATCFFQRSAAETAPLPAALVRFFTVPSVTAFLITIVIQDLWGQCIRKLMRYIAYGLAILAAMCAIAFTAGNLPRDATASHNNYTAVR